VELAPPRTACSRAGGGCWRGSPPLAEGVQGVPPENFFEIFDAKSRVWGQFGPENKLIEGQPNEHDVICRNASVLACCIHTSDIARRQHLQSAGCHQLFVPRHQRSMFGRRAFSVAGPAAWNSLPDYLRDPSRSFDSYSRDLKKLFFSRFTSVHSALGALRLCTI